MSSLDRKSFLSLTMMGSFGLITRRLSAETNDVQDPKPPALPAELVKEFVSKAHSDPGRVKELLQQQPGLLNASWDWGGGDFETAMEAAGHMGRKDIAQFLLENGARMNIFCAAMLGKIEIVKNTLQSFPDLKFSKGPHGLRLLHHARQGGDEAREVLEYLQSVGAS